MTDSRSTLDDEGYEEAPANLPCGWLSGHDLATP